MSEKEKGPPKRRANSEFCLPGQFGRYISSASVASFIACAARRMTDLRTYQVEIIDQFDACIIVHSKPLGIA